MHSHQTLFERLSKRVVQPIGNRIAEPRIQPRETQNCLNIRPSVSVKSDALRGVCLGFRGFLTGAVIFTAAPSLAQVAQPDAEKATSNLTLQLKQVSPETSTQPPAEAPLETLPTAPDTGVNLPNPTDPPSPSDRLDSEAPALPPVNPDIPSSESEPLPPELNPSPTHPHPTPAPLAPQSKPKLPSIQ